MDATINGLSTSQVVKRIEEVASSNIRAFELGCWLHAIDIQLPNATVNRSLRDLLDNEIGVKGRMTTKLKSFIRLYRIFQAYPPEVMNRLSDPIAHRLSQNILVGRVRPNSVITDGMCRMPREKALKLALSATSPEALAARLRADTGRVAAFRSEREIENWFKTSKEEFARQFGLKFVVSRAAAGRALGDIDHIFQRIDKGNLVLVLVELKDTVNFQDVGQVLGQRNEVIEHCEDMRSSRNRLAILYPKYRNDPGKYSKANSITIEFSDIEIWIVGQVFEDSSYLAAKGQDIHLLRIDVDRQIIGPCHAKDLRWEQWNDFVH
jgi:hypothetical protein